MTTISNQGRLLIHTCNIYFMVNQITKLNAYVAVHSCSKNAFAVEMDLWWHNHSHNS